MSIFHKTYDYCIKLSQHRLAPIFLMLNSFIESIFWPIPVDVMLIPMCLSQNKKALYYAFLATLASVLGAVVGYLLGYSLLNIYVKELIEFFGKTEVFNQVTDYLEQYGILLVLVGSFTPVPYKVVAICCGLLASQNAIGLFDLSQLNLFIFIAFSFLGRGARFFLIAWLIKLGGAKMEQRIRKYIDILGWIVIVAIAITILIYYVK